MIILNLTKSTDREKLEEAIAKIEVTEVRLRNSVQNENLIKLQIMLEKLSN